MDYGAAVSQKGYDVKTCADRNLVYSSAFQTLKIYNVYSVSTTIPSGAKNTITINHNLGYIAPYVIVFNGSSRYGQGRGYFFSDSSGNALYDKQDANNLKIDIYLNFDPDNSVSGDTVYFTVYLFLNDFTTVSHREINTGTSSGASYTDYGFRISKSGFDVKTCDDINCVISSSFFNQIIDQVGIYTATSNGYKTISFSSLGYIPSVLVYVESTGSGFLTYVNMRVRDGYLDTDYSLTNGDKIYYIILKNKLN